MPKNNGNCILSMVPFTLGLAIVILKSDSLGSVHTALSDSDTKKAVS